MKYEPLLKVKLTHALTSYHVKWSTSTYVLKKIIPAKEINVLQNLRNHQFSTIN